LQQVVKTLNDKNITLGELEMMHYAQQIAGAMAFISAKRIVHMDLAGRNCLLHSNNQIKIADFGLARKYNSADGYTLATRMKIPFKWCVMGYFLLTSAYVAHI
jgi:serine/threonine protein kinase